MTAPTTLHLEIAWQLADLAAQLESCQREIDAALDRIARGQRVYANTLHMLETAVDACKRVAVLQSVLA